MINILLKKRLFIALAFIMWLCYNNFMRDINTAYKTDKNAPAALSRCDEYNCDKIEVILRDQFMKLENGPDFFSGKRVVIKPNLVMAVPPERAATTHPAVVEAAIRVIKEYKPASITIAESPGGPYQPGLLKSFYNTTGMTDAAQRGGAELNFDTGVTSIHAPSGKVSKMFDIITPVAEAEVIVNISKLKTHTLAQMSAAAKNYFGVIAGPEKIAMHARFASYDRFFNLIVDLCDRVQDICPTLCIVDGIIGMEGNGPTGGPPKPYGCIVSGCNAFNVDLVCEAVLGLEGSVGTNIEAKSRGLCAESLETLKVIGPEPPSAFKPADMIYVDTRRGKVFFSVPKFLMPKPTVDRSVCVGCGVCARSCPASTIKISNKKASIAYNKCIRCFCCQELCHFRAIKIRKSFIMRLMR
jgi:Uncharacterized conserved protein